MSFTAQQSASGTLTASTQTTVTFGDGTANVPIRYAYVIVENTSASTSPEPIIYVRTDGQNATAGGDYTVPVYPGEKAVIANAQPLWTQAANVIPFSTSTASSLSENLGTDSQVQPYGSSFYGQKASPGTSVSMIGAGTTTPSYTVTGTG